MPRMLIKISLSGTSLLQNYTILLLRRARTILERKAIFVYCFTVKPIQTWKAKVTFAEDRRFRMVCQWRSWEVLKDDTDWYRLLVCLTTADAAECVSSLNCTMAKKTRQKWWVRMNNSGGCLYLVYTYMEISEKAFFVLRFMKQPVLTNSIHATTQKHHHSSMPGQ